MKAIEAIMKVLENCDVLLDGEVISKELLMRSFAEFLSTTTERDTHNVGYVLHTGSVCFDALALVYSAVTCLVYNDAKADDVISSLSVGDSVLYGHKHKSRYIFKGITTRSDNPGVNYVHLWKNDKDWRFVPQTLWGLVVPYYGSSKTMDGRGIRAKSNIRGKLYTEILGVSSSDIPSVLNASMVVVMSQERINYLVDKLSIRIGADEAKLTDFATVSYFTENEEHSVGGNAAKTEPIIKVTSKISVARRLLLSRNGNRHIGLIVFGNDIISKNLSELPELINRRSLQYVYLLMNLDYENALPLIHDAESPSVFFCSKDFLMNNSQPTIYHNAYTDELSQQVDAIINRDIKPHILNGYYSWEEYRDFKKSIFSLKNSDFLSDERGDFIITACSLMNIFLTSVFKITELEKCISDGIVDILSIEERFLRLKKSSSLMPVSLQEKAEFIISTLETAYLQMIDFSEKENYLRQVLMDNHDKKIALVVPKSYYATVMRECGFFGLMDAEKLLTITTANRFDNTIVYDRIIIVGNFTGKRFDVFRCMSSKRIETLLYTFESNLYKHRMRNARKAERELNSMNTAVSIEYDDNLEELYYSDGTNEEDVTEIAGMDSEVDDYMVHLNELATVRGLESYGSSQAANQTTEVIAFGTFDSGEKIFFTRMYKAYVFDDSDGTVKEVSVTDLNEGDSLVFTKNNDETRDIVDTILGRLVDEKKLDDDIIVCYHKSKRWKEALREYMIKNSIPAKEIASSMIKNGVYVQEVTIRGWLDEDSHTVGPRREDSIQQIALLVDDPEMFDNANVYHEACATIRRIRRDILSQIGKSIIDSLSGREPVPGTIMADIYERIGSIAQILRLERITSTERNVPINLINRPINIGG